ncbi:MAG: thiamine pyrophosphate-dependent enzyme [Parcubacteria group bacterium]|jgi:pyruvate ferredoxin oxidoreductase beta subunit
MNKEQAKNFAPGHSACAGCGIPTIVRTILGEAKDPVVVANATGCLEVTSTLYPYSAWKVPYIHNAFENVAATISGVERAYKALKSRGKTDKKIKFVAFAGDGGTYDIGLQSLSGALERGHDFLYVCYDNGGYMNTGNQRSSATPFGANTETTPVGKDSFGKVELRKNLMEIVNAHHIKYAAQASVGNLPDLKRKAQKAFATEGPSFLLVLQPCTNNWKFPTSMYVQYAKLAVETNFWPLYEIENGNYVINYVPQERKQIEEFLKGQGRFKHLFTSENQHVIEEMQQIVDSEFKRLQKFAG